jgi:tetraacyldisaccharide 4'-kinase
MQKIRTLLWPFSLIYGSITYFRNKLFDLRILSTYVLPNKSICVGNLNTGGTGKTPHVAYLTVFLSQQMETAILSRGYGRKTKGFIVLSSKNTAEEVGDEPLFYKHSFGESVHVAVCENRKIGAQKMQQLFPTNQLIILDDAFQHRRIKAGLNILLTDFHLPFSEDLVLPAGNLREFQSGKNRADIIIVTKCPPKLSELQKSNLAKSLKVDPEVLFFSTINYAPFQSFGKIVSNPKHILLITGIANPIALVEKLSEKYVVEHLKFSDHHSFSSEEIKQIHQKFDTFVERDAIILTTEKDFMRIKDFGVAENFNAYPWYYQPITVEIENEKQFKETINHYVNTI